MERPRTAPAAGLKYMSGGLTWDAKRRCPQRSKRRRELDVIEKRIDGILGMIAKKEADLAYFEELMKELRAKKERVNQNSPNEIIGGTYQSKLNHKRFTGRLRIMRERNSKAIGFRNKITDKGACTKRLINKLRREKAVYMRSFRALKGEMEDTKQKVLQAEIKIGELNALRHAARVKVQKELTTFQGHEKRLRTTCARLAEESGVLAANITDMRQVSELGRFAAFNKSLQARSPFLKRKKLREKIGRLDYHEEKNTSPDERGEPHYNDMWEHVMARTGLCDVNKMVEIFFQDERQVRKLFFLPSVLLNS